MSQNQLDRLVQAIRLIVQPISDAVKRNDQKIDDLAVKVAELKGEVSNIKGVGRWPWVLAVLALLVALAAMGEGELIQSILEGLL